MTISEHGGSVSQSGTTLSDMLSSLWPSGRPSITRGTVNGGLPAWAPPLPRTLARFQPRNGPNDYPFANYRVIICNCQEPGGNGEASIAGATNNTGRRENPGLRRIGKQTPTVSGSPRPEVHQASPLPRDLDCRPGHFMGPGLRGERHSPRVRWWHQRANQCGLASPSADHITTTEGASRPVDALS